MRALKVLAAAAGLLGAGPVLAALQITPITWNVIGLDSNNVNVGPDTFPVGARVCAVGAASAPVTATFVRTGATNPYITLLTPAPLVSDALPSGAAPPSQYTISTLPANCYDFYFEVQISRTTAARDTTQTYHISATNGTETVTTPTNRELFIEKLISQNRNGVDSFTGPSTVYVGQTVTYTVNGHTATGGYEQVEFAPVLPVLFQMLRVSVNMAVPTGGINSTVYADACGWENTPTNPDYWRQNNSDECHNADQYAGGKAGGDPVSLTYIVKAITAGSGTMTNVWYDYSGSSFHYNSDVGTGANALPFTIVNPQGITGTKSFSPVAIGPGGASSTLTITLNNPNPAPSQDPAGIPGVAFTDTFPTSPGQMTVFNAAGATNTCGGTLTENDAIDADTVLENGDGSLRLTGGTIPWNGSCTITIPVTASVPGNYTNTIAAGAVTTNYGGTSTNGAAISGTLAVVGGYKSVRVQTDADSSNGPSVGDTLQWSVFYANPTGSAAITNFQVTDTIGAGMALTATGSQTTSVSGAGCGAAPGINAAYAGTGNLLAAAYTLPANCTVRINYSTTVTAAGAGTTLSNQASGTGTNYATTLTDNIDNTTTGLPAGVTPTAGSIAQTQVAAISPTTATIPQRPTVTKAFDLATIPVFGTARATITLGNPNAFAITLTSALVDTLPSGLVVAATPNIGGTCTTASVTAAAGAGTITYANGATIPATTGCTILVNVSNSASTDATVANAAGVYTNTIAAGALQTTAGSNATAGTASVNVIAGYKSVVVSNDADSSGVTRPTVGDTLTWSVFYHNPSGGSAIASFQITDTIGANMTLTATGSQTTSVSGAGCGAAPGINAAYAGTGNLLAAGYSLAANCTVRVNYSVTVGAGAVGTTLSNQASATGTGLSATLTDNFDTTTTGQPAGVTATASSIAQSQLDGTINPTTAAVLQRPTVTKAFNSTTIPVLGTSVLTITLGNANATPLTLSSALTDTLPTGIVVHTTPAIGGTCTTANVTAVAGSSTITYASGSTIPATTGCTIQVTVRNNASTDASVASAAGTYTNTIAAGALVTNAGTNAAAGTADLGVVAGYKSVRLATDADASSSVTAGDTIEWTVWFRNGGGTAIAAFQATDTLSGSTISGTPTVTVTSGTCTPSANNSFNGAGNTNLFAAGFSLSAGCTVRVVFNATVNAASAGTTIGNQASGSGTGLAATLTDNIDLTTTGLPAGVTVVAGSVAQTQADTTLDLATVAVQPTANLAITKTDGVTSTGPSPTLTYTIVVSNAGPNAATGVTVADTFNAMYFTAASMTWTCVGNAGTSDCNTGTAGNNASGTGNISLTAVQINSGASITITVTAPVNAGFSGTVTNTATVSAPAGTYDPVAANNSATDNTTVSPTMTMVKSSTVVSDPYSGTTNPKRIPGAVIQYSIVISNATGTVAATSVVMNDIVPAQTTYVPASITVNGVAEDDNNAGGDESDPNGANFAAGTVSATISSIAIGASATVIFRVTVN